MDEKEIFQCYPELDTLFRDDQGQLWTTHEAALSQSKSGVVKTVERNASAKKKKADQAEPKENN